ncbi:MAG: enoyl-[acyl-carrier-protein] reductase FabK [Chloroflexi bacterium]|nr:enoyl-[acyl-carrier-protein] reductase FabK [Chloroflexota bacterium]
MIRTPLCDLLGIEHPILQGGMAWVATPELALAVSEAGGLGILGGGNAPPDWVRDGIHTLRASTDKPFGVNVPLFSPAAEEVLRLCAAERVPVVTTGAGNPGPYVPMLKEAGIKVIPVVASAALAKRLERLGVDALVAEGMEAGGHVGDVGTLPLVPQVVDAVGIPVIAAGGLADGRGLAAALALGAAGIQMGTRFICTDECVAHPAYKERIVRANDRSTIVTGHALGHPVRAIRNAMTTQFAALERRGVEEEELIRFGAGRLRLAVEQGDVQEGSVMAGQSAGLVHDVLPVRELLPRIVAEAEAMLDRLQALRS